MINTVKIQSNGYLLNGEMFVPNDESNKEYNLIQQWIDEGNTPEPEFTPEEIQANKDAEAIAKAKQYLNDTDYKVLPDYDGNTDGILGLRAEARATIRALES